MTTAERDAEISGLVIRYSENEKTIAALRSHFQEIAAGLEKLIPRLKNSPHSVTVEGDAFRVINYERPVIVDGDALRDRLREYREALEAKDRMESCLTQAGLANIIPKD